VHSKFQLLHSYVAYMVFLLLHEMLLTFVGGESRPSSSLDLRHLVCPNRTHAPRGCVLACAAQVSMRWGQPRRRSRSGPSPASDAQRSASCEGGNATSTKGIWLSEERGPGSCWSQKMKMTIVPPLRTLWPYKRALPLCNFTVRVYTINIRTDRVRNMRIFSHEN
jgi:hypothetical protein